LDDTQGDTLVTELRAAPSPCCAVMITGTTTGEAARKAIAAGAEDFLIKPVQTDLLLAALQRAVERTRLWRQHVEQAGDMRSADAQPRLSMVERPAGDEPSHDGGSIVARAGKPAAWPPLPTLRALDIERCADALAQIGGLTDRERRMLVPLLRGEHNEEIAKVTQTSQRTVKFHVSNILKKLRITQRSELLRFFF